MAGKSVGVVLSGGGSRGLAHLGVLTALEDAGVPLDAVGGTGQGAFMAALFAQVGAGAGGGGGGVREGVWEGGGGVGGGRGRGRRRVGKGVA